MRAASIKLSHQSLETGLAKVQKASSIDVHFAARESSLRTMLDDGYPTESSSQQLQVEEDVHELYLALCKHLMKGENLDSIVLHATRHTSFLAIAFGKLQGTALTQLVRLH